MNKHYLTALFAPRSVVIFTGDRALPQTALARVFFQHFNEEKFAGSLTYLDSQMTGSLADLASSRADLAILALPETELANALQILGRIQCRAAVIISLGVDRSITKNVHRIAHQHGIYLLGPDSLGFQRPKTHLNASALGKMAPPGPLAVVSQSGAVTSSILDWAAKNGVGFSTVVSLGTDSAIGIDQVLDFLADDASTHTIVIYLEQILTARRFMSSLRAAANSKPVIVLKTARHTAHQSTTKSQHKAHTHSAHIIDSDAIFDAALQRAGAVRVSSMVQLFAAAKCLSARYLPVGRRLAVISNGAGPALLAADQVHQDGLALAVPDSAAIAQLQQHLSQHAQFNNLLDLSQEASAQHYRDAVTACAHCKDIDGILVILSPIAGVDTGAIAQTLADLQTTVGKPLITCWMGDEKVTAARTILFQAGIPSFRTPEAAVDAFHHVSLFHLNQQLLRQVPSPLTQLAQPDLEGARILIESVLAERRKVLTEMESKALLSAFHIPVTKTILARSATEAILVANQLSYPVALKIDAPDIAHHSEIQGLSLNINNAAAVRDGWQDMMARAKRLRPDAQINGITVQTMSGKPKGREVYIGMATDPLFGPVIAFGAGGVMIEVIADRALELPPLNQFLAHRLIERVRCADMLGHWRGAAPINREALENLLLRVSEMICALPQLREMDINPIIVDADGALVVDAKIVVEHSSIEPGNYQHLAILPYPADREMEWPLRDGRHYVIRPLHPHDAEMLQDMVKHLSPESRYFRFASTLRELSERMLARFTLIDYDREMALVAIYTERSPNDDGSFSEHERIIGVSRYVTNPDKRTCEFSLLVADDFASQGLGSRLMHSIIEVARSNGLASIEGMILNDNTKMLALMRKLDFTIKSSEEDRDFRLCVKAL